MLDIHIFLFFFFNDTATTEIYTLSLHDALPISLLIRRNRTTSALRRFEKIVEESPTIDTLQERHGRKLGAFLREKVEVVRSEEHTSELQSPCNLVCRLLLEKKKKHKTVSYSIRA